MSKISAKRSISTSFFVDLGDIALNTTVMIITGSVVLLAEALEGATDLVASGLLFIGLKRSNKRANKEHPFGFGKALFTWTLLSATVMLIFGAGLSFYFGLKRFLDPHDIHYIGIAFAALGVSILTNGYSLSVSTRRLLDKQPLSQLCKALIHSTHVETKNTFILDLTGTSAAVIGMISLILYQWTGLKYLDGLGGMLMGTIVGVSSLILIWGVKDYLIGKKATPEIEQQIRDLTLSIKGVKDVLELNSMYVGSERLLLHLDIEVNKSATVKEMDGLINSLKDKIKKEVPVVTAIQVEVVASGTMQK